MSEPADDNVGQSPLRVAIVGPCASGKSTLVAMLRQHGYEAYVVAQEHSVVPGLWNHQHPDRLIALTTDLKTIRNRRGSEWPEAIYRAQIERLRAAYQAAGLVIDTGRTSKRAAVQLSLDFLRSQEAHDPVLQHGETVTSDPE